MTMPPMLTAADWEALKRAYADQFALRLVYERVIAELTAENERLKQALDDAKAERGD